MADPKGEGMKLGFDGSLRLEFHGAKVTSDAGLLAYRDLDEALGAEAGEQTLSDSLLKVKVYGLLAEDADILEDDRPDRCLTTPLGKLLIRLARCSQCVQCRSPTGVGPGAPVKGGEGPNRRAILVTGLCEGLCTQQLEGAGEGVTEGLRLKVHPFAGAVEEVLAAFDLYLQILLALAGGLELLFGNALALLVEVGLVNVAGQLTGVAVADAAPESALDVIIDDLREAAQLLF